MDVSPALEGAILILCHAGWILFLCFALGKEGKVYIYIHIGVFISSPVCFFRAARALGADSSVDFRKESYSETLQDFTAVVDTLGREKEGPQSLLMEAKGAAYFSLQPAILKARENVLILTEGSGVLLLRGRGYV